MPRMIELPKYDSDGAPAGVKDPAEDGGGGIPDVAPVFSPSPEKLKAPGFAGVEGAGLAGGLESGTTNLCAMVGNLTGYGLLYAALSDRKTPSRSAPAAAPGGRIKTARYWR